MAETGRMRLMTRLSALAARCTGLFRPRPSSDPPWQQIDPVTVLNIAKKSHPEWDTPQDSAQASGSARKQP